MKICFVTTDISELGGRQRVTAVVSSGLAEQTDIDVSILFTGKSNPSGNIVYPLSSKIHIYWDKQIAFQKRYDIYHKGLRYIDHKVRLIHTESLLQKIYFPTNEIKAYENFFKKVSFDVIIGVGAREGAVIGALNIQTRKVGWMHNSYKLYFLTKGYFYWRQECLYKKFIPNLHDLIVLSDGDVDRYEMEFEIKPKRIYNPLSFRSEKKSLLNKNKLLYVGRLDYTIKGLDLLVDIMSDLKQSYKELHLNIVGDGKGRKRLEKRIEENGLDECISVNGFTNDVIPYYLDSALLLLTSRQEGFGLVATEAMECGVPVISFDTEGPREIISDGKNGFLIKKYDVKEFVRKIKYLYDHPDVHKRMSADAVRRAGDFSTNNIITQWEQLLKYDYKNEK